MKQNDLGSKELTVTVKEVAEVLVASLIAAEKAELPSKFSECIVAVMFSLFKDYISEITAYINERAKAEGIAQYFKGMCNN